MEFDDYAVFKDFDMVYHAVLCFTTYKAVEWYLQLNSATFLPTRLIFVSLFWLQVLLKKTVDLTTINQSKVFENRIGDVIASMLDLSAINSEFRVPVRWIQRRLKLVFAASPLSAQH
jgi:Ni/Fe-hydrogenase subunit HybB-like protein